MERELWEVLCCLAAKLCNRMMGCQYGDDVICAVYWWALIHDRPVDWACQAENWPADLQRPLPSQATMSRRLRSHTIDVLLIEIERTLLTLWVVTGTLLVVDGKPLTVGGCSKDRDATWGRAAGGLAKGYKLHAV